MTKKTTRREQYSDLRGTLYLAFELGLKEWKLGFSIGLGQKARRRTIPGGDLEKLVREIAAAKKEKTRTTNRIRGLLATQGKRLEPRMDLSDARLEAIRLWDGKPLPPALKSRLKREWEHVLFLKKQIQVLEGERRRAMKKQEGADKGQESADMGKVRQLAMLGGIGTNGSRVLVRELFGWRKFVNRRQVASLSGLTPTPYQSRASRREQGISH